MMDGRQESANGNFIPHIIQDCKANRHEKASDNIILDSLHVLMPKGPNNIHGSLDSGEVQVLKAPPN